MTEVFEAILELTRRDGDGALCTVVGTAGSAPQKLGSKMLVRADGSTVGTVGGGAIERACVERAAAAIDTEQPELFHAHLDRDLAMCCGGAMDVFIEPVGGGPWLLIFGGGHVGSELCELAARAGFRVHVIDERAEFASPQRHPRASRATCAPPLDVLDDLPWTAATSAVITTHSHRLDEDLLAQLVHRERRYLGMIGSKSKVRRFHKRYAARGLDPALFAEVRAPIGLDIAALQPAEIAVSILAELIAVRRGQPLDEIRPMALPSEG